MIERSNPYDLNQIYKLLKEQGLKKKAQRETRNEAAQRKIRDLNARGELNPYDLGQISDIFGPLDPEDFL